jgi:hypothetical protein
MTPLEIQIALIYHATANDFRDGDFSAPAVRDAIDWFVDVGFLKLRTIEAGNSIYTKTGKLDAYCKKLCSIGLPKQTWSYED